MQDRIIDSRKHEGGHEYPTMNRIITNVDMYNR